MDGLPGLHGSPGVQGPRVSLALLVQHSKIMRTFMMMVVVICTYVVSNKQLSLPTLVNISTSINNWHQANPSQKA